MTKPETGPVTNVSISTYRAVDLSAVAPVFCDVFRAPPWNEPWTRAEAVARVAGVMSAPGARGWVAREDEHVVGFALGYEVRDGVGFLLHEMAVRADRQCRGIGTALMRALEHDLAAAGVAYVEVLTRPTRYPCYFYETNGYRIARDLGNGAVVLARAIGEG